jgi:poly-gamma-glutamate synthesis protein (capsule biosynthesis protein)
MAPLIQNVNGLRIALLSYTEHEFGIATETQSGTHPIDVIGFVRTVTERRPDWDFLIVLVHGGNEYFPYPRPKLRRLAQFMIEQGAGAVIFQHSHCAGCYESYRDGHIVHGQGNLLFDTRGARPCELEGVLVSLKLGSNGSSAVEFIPFRQSSSHPGPDLMPESERRAFMDSFEQRSKSIQQPGFIEEEWDRFARTTPYNYLALIHGYGQRVRELDQKFHFLRHRYSKKRMQMLLHLLRCESHHEATMQALSSALK